MPKDFPGGWPHRHPLPGTYPNRRLAGGEVCWSGFPGGTEPTELPSEMERSGIGLARVASEAEQ